MTQSRKLSLFPTRFLLWGFGGVLLLVFWGLVGCSDSTEPRTEPSDLVFSPSPAHSVINIFQGEGALFSLTSDPAVDLAFSWTLNGVPRGNHSLYQFESTHVGIDTLKLVYSYSSVQWNRTWYIKVEQNPELGPVPVPGVQLGHGPEAGDVVMSWFWISESVYPVTEYQMAVSYDGPITSQNWSDAISLGAVSHVNGQVGYSTTFTEEDHSIQTGRDGWFGIRGMDEVGQMSPLNQAQHHRVSFPWWIEGYIFSDRNLPLDGVIIDYGCSSCRVNTDGTGFYSIGPLSSENSYDIQTISRNLELPDVPFSSWYDFTALDVEYDPDGNNDFFLVTRFDLNGDCVGHDQEFMKYLRWMTNTSQVTTLRPNVDLLKWEEYPVSVYIPPFTGIHGYDFQELCSEVVGYWNLAMEDEYLYLVDSPEEARIEFLFDNEGGPFAGLTELILPDDKNYGLSEAIPEKMTVFISGTLLQSIRVQEVCMHELGHALGLSRHNACNVGVYLMARDPGGILANGPENAIHPYEKKAVRAIRNLPQGVDMDAFDSQ